MPACYRHSDRETGVSCSSCGRPICPDCMTPTPVGMRCPECSREKIKVRRPRAVVGGAAAGGPSITLVLIAVNVIVFLAEGGTGSSLGAGGGGSVFEKGALYGPSISIAHEYWRLVTAGFLHAGLIHLVFNMWFLYVLGQMLEGTVGQLNFAAIYLASLLAGSFGALLFQPDVPTVGASGAAFGVLGALIAVARGRGISIWESGLGVTLAFNLVFSLTFKGISIGGHIGGFAGGLLAGYLVMELAERRGNARAALAACIALGAVAVTAAIAVAGGSGLTPNGIGFV